MIPIGPIREGIGEAFTYIAKAPARVLALTKGGTPGSRFAPARTTKNDEEVGLRLDWGAKVTVDGKPHQELNVQLNKNAKNKTLGDHANKDTHRKWVTVRVPLLENATQEEANANAKKVSEQAIAELEGRGEDDKQ